MTEPYRDPWTLQIKKEPPDGVIAGARRHATGLNLRSNRGENYVLARLDDMTYDQERPVTIDELSGGVEKYVGTHPRQFTRTNAVRSALNRLVELDVASIDEEGRYFVTSRGYLELAHKATEEENDRDVMKSIKRAVQVGAVGAVPAYLTASDSRMATMVPLVTVTLG